MTYTEKLKQTATNSGVINYVFGSMAQMNVLLDKINADSTSPVCVHVQSIDGTMTTYPGTREERTVMLGYAERLPFDYDAEQSEVIADRLRGQCKAFLKRVNEGGFFDPVTEVSYSVLFDKMDANLLIVLMTFRLRESVGSC